MRLVSIAIENACEYPFLHVSGVHPGGDRPSAPETCARMEPHAKGWVGDRSKPCSDHHDHAGTTGKARL